MEKTSTQKWENSLLIYKKHCKQIIAISKSIRYVGIINEYGKTLSGAIKSEIKPLFSRSQVRDEFFAISSFMKLRSKAITPIGKLNYVFINHQKINSLILQNNKITYYVTFPANVIPSNLIITKIKKIIMQV